MKVTFNFGCATCAHRSVCKYKEETEEIMKNIQSKVDKLGEANEHLELNVVCSKHKY